MPALHPHCGAHRGWHPPPGHACAQATRLQRAIGVIYRPETERWSHYYDANAADQFDMIVSLVAVTTGCIIMHIAALRSCRIGASISGRLLLLLLVLVLKSQACRILRR